MQTVSVGDRVRYVPLHANGSLDCPDCENGLVVKLAADDMVIVKFEPFGSNLNDITGKLCHIDSLVRIDHSGRPVVSSKSIFAEETTTLSDIQSAGWKRYQSSSGSWWWVKDDDAGRREHAFIPAWIVELMAIERQSGALNVQAAIKSALGIR